MFKKVTGILLALAMVLSLAACTGSTGTDETAGSQDSAANQTTNQTEGTAFQPEKNLSQLVAERNPKDRMEEVTIALEIAREELGRAVAAVEKAAALGEDLIFAIGNAPTALIRLYELIREGKVRPRLVIGAPVGFVNVLPAKELIQGLADTPYIVAGGRKGGSNIAACICNALLLGT